MAVYNEQRMPVHIKFVCGIMGCMPCGLWSRDDFKRIFRKYNLSALGYEIAIWIYLVDGIHLQLESVVWVVSFLHAYDIGLSVDNLLQASAFFCSFSAGVI